MLSVDDEGENMKMTEYLKLPNTDNRMGFRLDMMRLMMLLKCPKAALLELNKVGAWDKSVGEGGVYFDFDFAPSEKMGELESPHGLSTGFFKAKGNVFNYYNSIMAVTAENNYILIDAHNNLKAFLDSSQLDSYEEFLNDVDKYYLYSKNLPKNKRTAPVLAATIVETTDHDQISNISLTFYFLNNYEDYRQDINDFMQKNNDNKNEKTVFNIQKDHLRSALNEFQLYLAYVFVGNSLGKFIFEKAPIDMLTKYGLIHKFVATKDNIFFSATEHDFTITPIEDKKCRTISENPDVNKNFGSDTTYTETFDMMYKAPELKIENSISTNLKDVKQEQNKDYRRR